MTCCCAAQGLAATGGFVVAIVGPRGHEVEPARQPAPAGHDRSGPGPELPAFGQTPATSDGGGTRRGGPDEVEPHVDALRLAGWRAIAVGRDEDVPHAWAVLTAATVGGMR